MATNANKTSDAALWCAACAAIAEVQGYDEEQRDRYMRSGRPLPPMIPTGAGNHVLTTLAGITAIGDIAEAWRERDQQRRSRIDIDKVRKIAVAEFGRMLAENDLRFWEDVPAAISAFKARLDARLQAIAQEVDHYFPCHVVVSRTAPSFDVGPVRFLRRDDWLEYARARALERETWPQIVARRWSQRSARRPWILWANVIESFRSMLLRIPSKSLTARLRKSHDDCSADDVSRAVGACQYVAVVRVKANELGRSRQRAIYAARLALDALGLVLSAEQASNLRGPGDELEVRRTVRLSQYPGRGLDIGWRIDIPHLFAHAPYAADYLDKTGTLRTDIGWAVDALLDSDGSSANYALRRQWCDAVWWFGDARRDETDFSALVRYGMCLDVLAKGGRAGGITNLLASLLDAKTTDPLLSDGSTIQQVVDRIYNKGRSQFGHGGRSALLEDLPIDRGIADQVAASTLLEYLQCLRAYTGPDDLDTFLAAVSSIVQNRKTSLATGAEPNTSP